jgi:hypothetical protein
MTMPSTGEKTELAAPIPRARDNMATVVKRAARAAECADSVAEILS